MGHHDRDRTQIACAIITVTDSRGVADDTSGATIRSAIEATGHRVCWSTIVPDEIETIRSAVLAATARADVTAALVTGGTGIGARDVTIEALETLWTKQLPGFGEVFRALSFAEIGPAAILSRASAGLVAGRLVAALPGSPAACRLAMERLIIPVLGHVAALLER